MSNTMPARVRELSTSRQELLEAISPHHGPSFFDKQISKLVAIRQKVEALAEVEEPNQRSRFQMDAYKNSAAITCKIMENLLKVFEAPPMVQVDLGSKTTNELIVELAEANPGLREALFGESFNADPGFCRQEVPIDVESRPKGLAKPAGPTPTEDLVKKAKRELAETPAAVKAPLPSLRPKARSQKRSDDRSSGLSP